MYIKLLCMFFAINTWCFGQLPGEGSTESIGSSGMTILLKNRESFQDDPSVLCKNNRFGLAFQHLLRASFTELSTNRISLFYRNLGVSISKQATSPLSLWNGLLAVGLPMNNRLKSGVNIGISALQSLEQPLSIFQYSGCLSIQLEVSERLNFGVRWEHQHFINSRVISRPALGFRFSPDQHWSILSGIDWVSTQTVLNYHFKVGYQLPKYGYYAVTIGTQPFQLSFYGSYSFNQINLSLSWNYGLAIGPLSSQSLNYLSQKDGQAND